MVCAIESEKKNQIEGPCLDESSWKEFVDATWCQKGKLMQFQVPLATEQEIFDIVVEASEKYRNKGKFADLKMFVDSKQMLHQVKRHLPSPEDANLESFVSRLDQMTGNKDFMIFINQITQYSPVLTERVQHFLYPFIQQTGIPKGSIDVEMFLGRYVKTPGSIHRASCHNFHFTISGNKYFYIWPPHAAKPEDNPIGQLATGSEEYLSTGDINWRKEHRGTFIAAPGQATYCPGLYWHVGSSPELCMCVNISVYMDGWAKSVTLDVIEEAIKDQFGKENKTVASECWSIELNDCFQAVKNLDFQDKLNQQRIMHQTACAVAGLPPKAEASLESSCAYKKCSAAPIMWDLVPSGQLFVSANGYCECMDNHQELIELIDKLNKSEEVVLSSFSETALCEKLLTELLKMRAIA